MFQEVNIHNAYLVEDNVNQSKFKGQIGARLDGYPFIRFGPETVSTGSMAITFIPRS